MTNLMPQKIVDKNGVLTTRNVRVMPKASTGGASLPSPKLSQPKAQKKAKPPTASQMKRDKYAITASIENPDRELVDTLGIDPELGIYRFNSSEHDIYSLMSRMETGTALALLQAQRNSTTEEKIEWLETNCFDHLLVDRSYILEAEARRIPVDSFLHWKHYWSLSDEDFTKEPLLMDSMEALSQSAIDGYFGHDVRMGNVSIADIKELGVTRIKKSHNFRAIRDALQEISGGEAYYSVADLKVMIDKCAESGGSIEHHIGLANIYGGEFASKIDNIFNVKEIGKEMVELGISQEKRESVILWADEFWNNFNQFDMYNMEVEANTDVFIRLHDANISPTDYATQKFTLRQLEAIEDEGISSSISDGWL